MNARGITPGASIGATAAAAPVDPVKLRHMAKALFEQLKSALIRSDYPAFRAAFAPEADESAVRYAYDTTPRGGRAVFLTMTELTVHETAAYGGVNHMQPDTLIVFEQVAPDKVQVIMFGRL